MDDLIKALTIFQKYNPNNKYPTHCEHDVLYICGVDSSIILSEDRSELERLGFLFGDNEEDEIYSFRYGSA